MTNIVNFIMKNVPSGLDSMYVRVEEDVLTTGVRNVLFTGVKPVNANVVEIDIGNNGTVGNGAIISADNYTSGGSSFKSFSGYSLIEAGATPALPSFNYDAVVFIGDSITNQSAESREDKLVLAFEQAGFNPVTEVYGSGISGHTPTTEEPDTFSQSSTSASEQPVGEESTDDGGTVNFVSSVDALGNNTISMVNNTSSPLIVSSIVNFAVTVTDALSALTSQVLRNNALIVSNSVVLSPQIVLNNC